MSKTNKELSIDVAIAYLEANGNLKMPNGGSKNLISLESICNIIKGVHQTLEEIDKK